MPSFSQVFGPSGVGLRSVTGSEQGLGDKMGRENATQGMIPCVGCVGWGKKLGGDKDARAGTEAVVGYRTRGFRRRRCCKPGAMIDRAGKRCAGRVVWVCGAAQCRMCAVQVCDPEGRVQLSRVSECVSNSSQLGEGSD
jgi:hypothetical protein